MRVVVVASGLATRLKPITDHIPKLLVNTGKNTGLVNIVESWKDVAKKGFVFIVHPKHERLTRAYAALYYEDVPIEVLTCETALGTLHTIVNTLEEKFDGEDLLFTWCDVFPQEPVKKGSRLHTSMLACSMDGRSIIFTENGGRNRYDFLAVWRDDEMRMDLNQVDNSGNVCGMYFVPSYKRAKFTVGEPTTGVDFVEEVAKHEVEVVGVAIKVNDFGDMVKLQQLVTSTRDGAREFNAMYGVGSEFLHKVPLNDKGVSLSAMEQKWYQEIHDRSEGMRESDRRELLRLIPRVFCGMDRRDGFIMGRIDGVTLAEKISTVGFQERKELVVKTLEALDTLHSMLPPAQFDVDLEHRIKRDVEVESKMKLISRCAEIEDVVDAFGWIDGVNGIEVELTSEAILKLHDFLSEHYAANVPTYSLVHGDPQFSNTMVDSDGRIVFIDPRGYFGDTRLYGLADYDKAKVLYSLSGYDEFNSKWDFHVAINDGHIIFDIPSPEIDFDLTEMFEPVHFAWLAVIWIGLAQYIKNDPIKSIAALSHGRFLATKFLKSVGRCYL